MKTTTPQITAALAVLALAFAPALMAQQTSGPDQTQNARANDSTADQHASTTGAPGQGNTVNMNDSKDGTTESLDKNPSNASTDSGMQSTTKDPSDSTTTAAEKNSSNSSGEKSEKPLTDKEFVMRASQGGMTEVELGKVASEKASSSQVKDFGSRMVKDHSQANDELKSLAEKKGFTVASSLDSRHQAQVQRVSKLSGSAFDKAYVKNQVMAHEMTVQLFREEAQSGQDPDLKAFASKTLPTLEDHESCIKEIQSGKDK